jgi:uncharacterized protein YdaU (DUF1376 family)
MKRPWMPFYVTDFLADTLDLQADETGIYVLLLLISWQRDDAAIPNDMQWLKRSLTACVSDMHGNRFNRIVPKLLNRYFTLSDDNKYRNKRLVYEREKAEKWSEKQKENANKRWSETNKNKYLGDATAMPARAQHLQLQLHKKESAGASEALKRGPLAPAFSLSDWESVVKTYKIVGRWSRDAGPEPPSPACRCPAELLAKYGIGLAS